MSHTTSQKIKLLVLYDILCRLTDEEHALNTDELIHLLGEKGIQVDPRVLKSDIDMLNDYGYEVLSYKKKYYYFYVASRQFESAEIAMLADVVSASKLNANRKKTLIGKLAGTLGNNKANVMMKNVLSFEKPKRTNAHIIYSIDRIDTAINDKKKVSFLYFSLDYTGNKVYRKDGKRYLVNPLVMIWNQDNYYLLCYDDKHPDLVTYRILNFCFKKVWTISLFCAIIVHEVIESFLTVWFVVNLFYQNSITFSISFFIFLLFGLTSIVTLHSFVMIFQRKDCKIGKNVI